MHLRFRHFLPFFSVNKTNLRLKKTFFVELVTTGYVPLFYIMHQHINFAFVRNKDYNFLMGIERYERIVNSFNKWITLGPLEGPNVLPLHESCLSGYVVRREIKCNSISHMFKSKSLVNLKGAFKCLQKSFYFVKAISQFFYHEIMEIQIFE